jgi:polysaccharide export outer membrane protein
MSQRSCLWFLGIALLVLSAKPGSSAAQTPVQSPQKPPEKVMAPRANAPDTDLSYRIGANDLLDIRVFGRPDMAREARVSNLGLIRMPFVGEIRAACRTESELVEALTEKYKKYLKDPQVDVIIKEYKSQPVAVIGSVNQPGRFQLQRRFRLLELLTFAGGPNPNAGSTVHVIRNGEGDSCASNDPAHPEPARIPIVVDDVKTAANAVATAANGVATTATGDELPTLYSFKLKDVLAGVTEANIYVNPGDVISIPETEQIFVTGLVVKPGPLPMKNKMTLTEAIAMAGGCQLEAARKSIRLIRGEPGSESRTEKVINLNDIEKRKVDDIALLPNDVIDVPNSTMKNIQRGLIGVGLGALGTLPFFIAR